MLEFLQIIAQSIVNGFQSVYSVFVYLISFSNSLPVIFTSGPPFMIGALNLALIAAVIMWIINIF